MVRQAAGQLGPLPEKSDATLSRAGITLSVDNSVTDPVGRMIRCTYNWYSGRWKKVVSGNDLPGIVMTVNGIALPLNLLFCPKQGRANTGKPSLLISMLSCLIEEFAAEGIDITSFPITPDSWFVSEDLKKELITLGFKKIAVAGKSSYVFKIKNKKQKVSGRKKKLCLSAVSVVLMFLPAV